MRFIKKMVAPREVRNVLKVLDAAEVKYGSPGFSLVKSKLEHSVLHDPKPLIEAIGNGVSPHQAVYMQIANVAGDLLESGTFHVHRGVLNPLNPSARTLLELHDHAVEELVALQVIDPARAEEQKRTLRANIAEIG